MNTRFPVLSTISGIMRFVGWALVLVGALYGLSEGIIEPSQPGHRFGTEDAFQLGFAILGAVLGIITAAFGEVIGVLFAIEENTRQTAAQRPTVSSATPSSAPTPSAEAPHTDVCPRCQEPHLGRFCENCGHAFDP